MIEQDKAFNLFANCIPVKGHTRSIICDVHRKRFRYIPNALFHILTKHKKSTITEIKQAFLNEYDSFIDEYFAFLDKNEFGFSCKKSELIHFPKLDLTFDFPSVVSNCIIDFNPDSTFNYKKVFAELNELNCNHWQLRFFGDHTISRIHEILSESTATQVASIQLILPFYKSINKTELLQLYMAFPICQIDFYNVSTEEIYKWKRLCKHVPFNFHNFLIENETHCGKVELKNFQANVIFFSESKTFNSCLNRKISIDVNGEIKNCPSMKKSFVNVENTALPDVLEKQGFKDVWNINKDKIKICKDCEFRYICTDCRAYVENPTDAYSKPLKCGYDPYTNKWKEWSTNPLKQEAIVHYGIENIFSNLYIH